VNKIKAIVDLWFDQSDEAQCKELVPSCEACPFFFQIDPQKEEMACKTIWLLLEKANNNQKPAREEAAHGN
jgi:hypothetical protein